MAKPGLTIHRMELFLAVLDRGGIARAAVAKNISQPAVSEHLRGLEEHFGVMLFERAGRNIRPTAAARVLEPYARQAVHQLQAAEQAANDLRGVRAGKLMLGASSTPGTYLLPPLLGTFRQEHSSVSVSLQIGNTRDVEHWVSSGEVDLGVVGETVAPEGLATDPWLDDQLVLLVGTKHPLARRRMAAPTVLASQPWIARERGSSTRRFTERFLSEAGVQALPAMELGSTEAVREAVAAGLGVAVVSRYTVPSGDRRTVALPIEGGGWRRQLMVLRRVTSPLAPVASRFRADLLSSDAAKAASVA
jgi:DNA-binding transcriptional LysR family regulator